MLCWKVYLEIPEFREGVDDDAKDDVEADGGDEDEEAEIIIIIKRYSLTRVKLTALYKHLITKTTLAYTCTNKTLIIVA